MDEIDPAEIVAKLRAIFRGRDRFAGFSLGEDLLAYWTVSTAHYQRITAAEIADVVAALGIQAISLELEDCPPNAVRFVADLAPITKPEMPSAKRREHP